MSKKKRSIKLFGQNARVLAKADLVDDRGIALYDTKNLPVVKTNASIESANLVTSAMPDGRYHLPAIDIDVPIAVVPSSTPGHSHLYINRVVTWKKYVALLEALADAGIVEDGYVEAAKAHGFTSLRLPWVQKEPKADPWAF